MKLNVPYLNLAKRETEAAFGAIVEILLKSRLTMSLDTNKGFYDEDVNTYLAGVLVGYIDAQYQHAIQPLLSDRDADVFLQATRTDDAYCPYWVYKVNADDRLMGLGIFCPQRAGHDTLFAQMKTYYGFAAGYHQRRYGRATAISEIMDKLSRWTERYLSILHQARHEYLHFVEGLTDDELREFRQGLEREAGRAPLKATQDQFLDVYAQWQRTPSPDLKARLLQLSDALRRLDPLFHDPNCLIPNDQSQ